MFIELHKDKKTELININHIVCVYENFIVDLNGNVLNVDESYAEIKEKLQYLKSNFESGGNDEH